MATRILFTGAAGRVGREAIGQLKRAAPDALYIRACCRDGEFSPKADALRNIGADEVVTFDFADASTYEKALDNMQQIYHCSPDPTCASLDLARQQVEFARAIKSSAYRDQLDLIVRLSAIGVNTMHHSYTDAELIPDDAPQAGVPHIIRTYATIERLLMETGIPVTSLRGGFFMNHMIKADSSRILGEGTPLKQDSTGSTNTEGDKFVLPFGETKRAEISTVDIGEAVAAIFLDQLTGKTNHGGQLYTLTGGKALTMHDVARDLRTATGKQNIQYSSSPDDGKAFSQEIGPTRWHFLKWLLSSDLADLHEEFVLGGHRYVHSRRSCDPGMTYAEFCSHDIARIIGREPLSYLDHLIQKNACGQTGLQDLKKPEGCTAHINEAIQSENPRAGKSEGPFLVSGSRDKTIKV